MDRIIEKNVYTMDQISDKEFFTSKELRKYLEDMANIMLRRYSLRQKIKISIEWNLEDDMSAETNNHFIRINAGHRIAQMLHYRITRFRVVIGLLLHEMGHILYSNFELLFSCRNSLASGRFMMVLPATDLEYMQLWEECNTYLQTIVIGSPVMRILVDMFFNLHNIIEDANVEQQVMKKYPGYKGYVEILRDIKFNHCSSIEEIVDNRVKMGETWDDAFRIYDIISMIFSYALFGTVKGKKEALNDSAEYHFVCSLKKLIKKAVLTNDSSERIKLTNMLFLMLFPYWKELMEYCKNQLQDSRNNNASLSGQPDASDDFNTMIMKMNKETAPDSSPMPEDCVSLCVLTYEGEDDSVSAEGTNNTKDESPENNIFQSEASDAEKQEISEMQNENKKSDNTSNVGNNDEKEKTSCLDESTGKTGHESKDCSLQLDPAYGAEPEDKRAFLEIEKLLRLIDEAKKERLMELERVDDMNAFARKIQHRAIHNDISVEIRRPVDITDDMVERFELVAPPLIAISKRLQKSLLKVLQTRIRGAKMTNLYMGRRLEPRTLVRNDGKCFSKRQLPAQRPKLSVGILIDESGSMQNNQKLTYACATAIVLQDFCTSLKIPVGIYGHHTATRPDVVINTYSEFKKTDKNDIYRLMALSCGGANRDGYALRYVCERMLRENSEIKLLIILSDGRPNDRDYYGEVAYDDLVSIKEEYTRKGVTIFAAAIDQDKDIIERIYKNGFLDITDISELPEKLVTLVKSFV